LGRKQVEDFVANLAQMHGTMWEHPDLHALPKTPVEHFRFRQSRSPEGRLGRRDIGAAAALIDTKAACLPPASPAGRRRGHATGSRSRQALKSLKHWSGVQ
jgi:hypothetical protein